MKKSVVVENILCLVAGILIALWAMALVLGDGSLGIYRLLGYE